MKAICLISGGIDSPVASYLMARQGVEIMLLHMDNRPYSLEDSVRKAASMAGPLRKASGQHVPFCFAPHGRNQEIIASRCQRSYQCVLCKRLMLRVAKEVALRMGADAIVTGESLGQVASQTLSNLRCEQAGLDFPLLRPLIGLDKLEIEKVAKEIGTYEISISTRGPACSILPDHVVTMAREEDLLAQEAKMDIEEMVAFAARNARSLTDPDTSSS
jgi:thiamine biosynthesis protein ThiI